MEIFVINKVYRQKDGEYVAVETEAAFTKKEDVEAFLKNKPGKWWETRQVPVNTGEILAVEFEGVYGVHPTELHGV